MDDSVSLIRVLLRSDVVVDLTLQVLHDNVPATIFCVVKNVTGRPLDDIIRMKAQLSQHEALVEHGALLVDWFELHGELLASQLLGFIVDPTVQDDFTLTSQA